MIDATMDAAMLAAVNEIRRAIEGDVLRISLPEGADQRDATQRRAFALFDIAGERLRQIKKWGDEMPDGGFVTMATVLGEEFGEACQAVLKGQRANLREELVQIAAVAVRMIEQLDRGEYLGNREG